MKNIYNKHIFIAAAIFIAAILLFGFAMAVQPVSSKEKLVKVSIAKGQNARQVAIKLKESGVIRSAAVFRVLCKLSGDGSKLKPGAYIFSESMTPQQIIEHMVSGDTAENWLTIPEGYTIRQIADRLQEKDIVDGDRFVDLALAGGAQFDGMSFINGYNLEGYLFPDTYLFQPDADPKDVARAMLNAFENKVVKKYRAEIIATGKHRFNLGEERFDESLYNVLIMASLIEREARVEKDRPVIAAVLWNRLEKHIKLEICATVSYIPGVSRENKAKIYNTDTKADTPYNTYQIYGLPPSPICNPGLASIKAVLHPADVDYLYYVAKSDGSHIFSRTYSEHVAAKRNGSAK